MATAQAPARARRPGARGRGEVPAPHGGCCPGAAESLACVQGTGVRPLPRLPLTSLPPPAASSPEDFGSWKTRGESAWPGPGGIVGKLSRPPCHPRALKESVTFRLVDLNSQ